MTEADVTDVSEEARDPVLNRLSELRFEGLFTPPDPRGTLLIPGTRGGSEWGGTAFDPAASLLFLNANESPEIMTLQLQGIEEQGRSQSLYSRGELRLTDCGLRKCPNLSQNVPV